MPNFSWNDAKNIKLTLDRKLSFQDVVDAFEQNRVVAIKKNPNRAKYPQQYIIYFIKNDYAYSCPFIIQEDGIYFLKTIYPSRKAVKAYLTKK